MEKRSFYVRDRLNDNCREINLTKFEILANYALTLEEKQSRTHPFRDEICGHFVALVDTLYSKKKVDPTLAFYKKMMDDIYPYEDATQLLNTLILMKPIIEKFKMEGIGDLRLVEKFNNLSEKYREIMDKNDRENKPKKDR